MIELAKEPGRLLHDAASSRPGWNRDSDAGRARPIAEAASAVLVGQCLQDRHPLIDGRYLVAFTDSTGEDRQQWLACLEGIVVQAGDRVLLVRPGNSADSLVVGVVSHGRPRPKGDDSATVVVRQHETIHVATSDGETFMTISRDGDGGPTIRLAQPDVSIDVPGKLQLAAEEISLQARNDVAVKGRTIRLN